MLAGYRQEYFGHFDRREKSRFLTYVRNDKRFATKLSSRFGKPESARVGATGWSPGNKQT